MSNHSTQGWRIHRAGVIGSSALQDAASSSRTLWAAEFWGQLRQILSTNGNQLV